MPDHLYVVVDCKTRGCKNVLALQYQGADTRQIAIGEETPTGLWYQCAKCGQTHHYDLDESRIERFPFPPPVGWKNSWGPDSPPVPSIDPKKIH